MFAVPPPVAVFECRCDETVLGQAVFVVGNIPQLGEWSSNRATALITSHKEFPLWRSCVIRLDTQQPGDHVEFKFFVAASLTDPLPRWERCQNRRFRCPKPGQVARVVAHFGANSDVAVTLSESTAPSERVFETTTGDEGTDTGTSAIHLPATNREEQVNDPVIHPARFEPVANLLQRLRPSEGLTSPIQAIINQNEQAPSMRQKLMLARNIIWEAAQEFGEQPGVAAWRSQRSRPLLEALAGVYIYINWVGTGALLCKEDGGHHRPNQTALVAKDIMSVCERLRDNIQALRGVMGEHIWEADVAEHFTRQLQPYLPSFSAAFTCAVPLTRIRDIAHRNDINQDLKREIKTRLQNKLHRCAGPEDLKTSTELLNRFHHHRDHYPPDFIREFEIFHDELIDFFNAGGLVERIEKIKSSVTNSIQTNAINRLLVNKRQLETGGNRTGLDKADSLLNLISTCTNLRAAFGLDFEKGAAFFSQDASHAQSLRLADLQVETYLFTLFSQVLNEIDSSTQTGFGAADVHFQARVLSLLINLMSDGLKNLGLSGFAVQICRLIARETRVCFDGGRVDRRYFLLHTASISRRVLRITQAFSDLISAVMPVTQTERFGCALGVSQHAARIFTEGQIRGSLFYQLSRAASLALRLAEVEGLKASPYATICDGETTGLFIPSDTMDLLEVNLRDALRSITVQPTPMVIVLYLRNATGDEEIEGVTQRLSAELNTPICLGGILLAHDLPALSHLGVRARQGQIPFVAISAPVVDLPSLESRFKHHWVKLSTKGSGELLTIASGPPAANVVGEVRNIEASKGVNADMGSSVVAVNENQLNDDFSVLLGSSITLERCGAKASACQDINSALTGGTIDDYCAPLCACLPFGSFEASLDWAENAAEATRIRTLIAGLSTLRGAKVAAAAEELKEVVDKMLRLSEEAQILLQKAILDKFLAQDLMGSRRHRVIHLMVRSSSNVEDLKGVSGAGLYESLPAQVIIDLEGQENRPLLESIDVSDLWRAIKIVWTSLYTERAVLARRAANIRNARMAVLIQPLIPAVWSFIAHTRCPQGVVPELKGVEDKYIYVECARGLGEALAGGVAGLGGGRPTRIAIAEDGSGVVCDALWDLHGRYETADGHLERIYTALRPNEASSPFWTALAARLQGLRRLEQHFGSPQDVEGCFVDSSCAQSQDELNEAPSPDNLQVFVLQSRPQAI